ncbi:uncharacterized protein LOC132756489 [Ruditapes philippinarum]|uniref:uncharacterized protein LOC132756489 n=1 Tax=Ruditapes philippinarum TaxID=129788 RepID=UPI00295BD30F|nr:uncharacterized protein LOC132756489 [Ruditapes philippinarum]
MAPVFQRGEICGTVYNISIVLSNRSCSDETANYSEEDKHALLYIVCTLLFYSLGIMVGIVSYIKREKHDIEQDRMFNDFLNSFKDKTEAKHYRQLQVQETIDRLAEIDRRNSSMANSTSTGKHISNKKQPGEEKRMQKFVSLSVKQPPVAMTTDIDSSCSKKINNKTFTEESKEQMDAELGKNISVIAINKHQLNVEAPVDCVK